jgi:hypothetical protein
MRAMSTVVFGMLIAGGCQIQPASAQTKDGPFQRLVNFFSPKTKSDTAVSDKEKPRPAPKASVSSKSAANAEATSTDSESTKATPALPAAPGPKATLALPAATDSGSTIAPASASTKPAAPIKSTAPAPATTTKAPPLNNLAIQRLTRQVTQVCPKARNVKIVANGSSELTVEMEARTAEECNDLAERIFTIRDLDPYRVNLKFNVNQK